MARRVLAAAATAGLAARMAACGAVRRSGRDPGGKRGAPRGAESVSALVTTCWVACGGALGTIARYWLAIWARPLSRTLPLETIGINIAGSFLIGFFRALI